MEKHRPEASLMFDWITKVAAGLLAFFAVNSFNRLNESITDLNSSQKELSKQLSEVVTRIANQSAVQDGLGGRVSQQEDRIRFMEQKIMGAKWAR